MKNSNIDKSIKGSFEQYQTELNHDEIWENIEPHLKKKKRRRFIFFWLLGGLAIFGIFLISLLYKGDSPARKEVVASKTEGVKNSKSVSDNKPSITVDDKLLINEKNNSATGPLPANNDKLAYSYLNTNEGIMQSNNKVQRNSLLYSEQAFSEITSSKYDPNLLFNQELNKQKKDDIQEEYQDSKGEEKSRDKGAKRETVSKETKDENLVFIKDDNNEETARSAVKDKEISDFTDPIVDKSKKEEVKIAKKEKVKVSKKRKGKKKGKKKKKPIAKEQETKKVKMRKPKYKFILQPTVSAIVPLRILQEYSVQESSYLAHRKEYESQLEAFAFGLNGIYQTRRGLILMTGLEMQRLNSRYEIREVISETQVVNGTISVVENSFGVVVSSTTGPKEIQINSELIREFYNHHVFVNVPIGIGRSWSRRKFDFSLLGGLDFNIYHNFKGLIKGETGDLDFRRRGREEFEETFKRKTGVGIWINTGLQKEINQRLSLSVAPKIQIPFSSITSAEYVLDQRFLKFSLEVGANFLIYPEPKKKKKKK